MAVEEQDIRSHWQARPVGENVVGTLEKDFSGDFGKFIDAYDSWYYSGQAHVLEMLDRFDWRNKKVLEIGLGQGSDAEQLIRRGALWSGIDLTAESVSRVSRRMAARNLPYEQLVQGSVVSLPFPDGQFDRVFSHGVLHHVPDVVAAQREIRRVLKDDGRLVIMVYARWSLNYQIAIKLVRRAGLAMIYFLPLPLPEMYRTHKENARKVGLLNYLKMKNFVHRSTDGPNNPYAKVYDRRSIEEDFPDFEIVRTFRRYMHAPPLPVHGLPGGRIMGWHLWAELRPRASR